MVVYERYRDAAFGPRFRLLKALTALADCPSFATKSSTARWGLAPATFGIDFPVQLGIRLDIRATSKTVRLVRYPAASLLIFGILLAPVTASADQLCGRQFDSLSQLYADLRKEADDGWRVIERSTHVILAGNQMIWAFARESQPAFPAAACLQIVPVDDSIGAIVQIRCDGAKDACDAVAAKAKTKDWSNLFSE